MDFVKPQQEFLDAPTDKGFVSQHFVVTENDAELVNVRVPIVPTDADLPAYWVQVGANRVRSISYVDGATPPNETAVTSVSDVVPVGFGDETQLDQRTSDTRPTD
jgi:hypothetical protein